MIGGQRDISIKREMQKVVIRRRAGRSQLENDSRLSTKCISRTFNFYTIETIYIFPFRFLKSTDKNKVVKKNYSVWHFLK